MHGLISILHDIMFHNYCLILSISYSSYNSSNPSLLKFDESKKNIIQNRHLTVDTKRITEDDIGSNVSAQRLELEAQFALDTIKALIIS